LRGGARNRAQSTLAEAERRVIRDLLAARRQDEPLFTHKELLRILGWPTDRLRTVRRHVRAIRASAPREPASLARSALESAHECGEDRSPPQKPSPALV